MAQHTILSTKKIEPELAKALSEKGVELVEQEFIAIKKIITREKYQEVRPWIVKPDDTAIVFTSHHAVTCVTEYLHAGDTYYVPGQWYIFCLGGATQEQVLQRHDKERIVATASNAADLADKIIEDGRFKEVVFFCGNKRRDELPDKLKASGIQVHEVVVYETVETPQVATGNVDAVLFFSPSAVKSFFTANQLKPDTTCFAIGETTAKAISRYTGNRIITSEQPSQHMMIVSVLFYLQNIDLYK